MVASKALRPKCANQRVGGVKIQVLSPFIIDKFNDDVMSSGPLIMSYHVMSCHELSLICHVIGFFEPKFSALNARLKLHLTSSRRKSRNKGRRPSRQLSSYLSARLSVRLPKKRNQSRSVSYSQLILQTKRTNNRTGR